MNLSASIQNEGLVSNNFIVPLYREDIISASCILCPHITSPKSNEKNGSLKGEVPSVAIPVSG